MNLSRVELICGVEMVCSVPHGCEVGPSAEKLYVRLHPKAYLLGLRIYSQYHTIFDVNVTNIFHSDRFGDRGVGTVSNN